MSDLNKLANAIRILSVDMIEQAKSGHPGMPLGFADVITILFSKFLKFYCHDPDWFDRDRFILSAGHGSAMLYSLAYLLNYRGIDIEDLKKFRQINSITCGHPERQLFGLADVTTGPLGQGLANGVGMAMAEKMMRKQYNDKLINHYTYVVVGDGCLMEGISQEAISLAGHNKLAKLIVLWDDNNITIDGNIDICLSDNYQQRFQACNWEVIIINGYNAVEIEDALSAARYSDRPSLIRCKTIIGYGIDEIANTSKAHGQPVGSENIEKLRAQFDFCNEPFVISQDILEFGRSIGEKAQQQYEEWYNNLNNYNNKECLLRRMNGDFFSHYQDDGRKFDNINIIERQDDQNSHDQENILVKYHNHLINGGIDQYNQIISFKNYDIIKDMVIYEKESTRKSSGRILAGLQCDFMIGGSADLAESNCIKDGDNIINFGVREHVMSACINGISAHGGFLPYAATFFVFSDYARPAIRLAALMQLRSIYIFTHDSIGLGEDGPTHQPVEHLASFRAMPNIQVWRPCDFYETKIAWLSAVLYDGPTAIILTRQDVKTVSSVDADINKGAYLLRTCSNRDVTLLATGSEVELACEVSDHLAKHNISAAVVSMPCWELFEQQSERYKLFILGNCKRFAIEAGSSFGWDRYIENQHHSFCIDEFGQSGKSSDLFKHFNLHADYIVESIIAIMNK